MRNSVVMRIPSGLVEQVQAMIAVYNFENPRRGVRRRPLTEIGPERMLLLREVYGLSEAAAKECISGWTDV